MKSQKNIRLNKLIGPTLIQYNENEKKNESPSSDSKISVKPIIKPKPLNINIINGINNKSMNKKEIMFNQNIKYYGNSYSPKYYISDKPFSK